LMPARRNGKNNPRTQGDRKSGIKRSGKYKKKRAFRKEMSHIEEGS